MTQDSEHTVCFFEEKLQRELFAFGLPLSDWKFTRSTLYTPGRGIEGEESLLI